MGFYKIHGKYADWTEIVFKSYLALVYFAHQRHYYETKITIPYADLIQLYTGFIYEGPGLVKRINQKLLESE